jgi:DNA-binding NarL/FixJ family response regulator
MRRLRIVLADSHQEILELLKALLEPDFAVVSAVEDGQSLVVASEALRPDVVLTDIDIPILNGIQATRQLHKTLPECRVIFYSSHGEPKVMAAAFAAGAAGYVIKGSSQSVISSIRVAARHV